MILCLGDLTDLLREIMVEARKLTNAERCSIFLLDSEHNHLVAKIFDGESSTEVSFMNLISFSPSCIHVAHSKSRLCLACVAFSKILTFVSGGCMYVCVRDLLSFVCGVR